MAGAAFALQSPLVFPSLGATAFLLFTSPHAPAASPRNTIIGHAVGVAMGWVSLAAFGLLDAGPAVVDMITGPRAGAAALSLGLTACLLTWLRSPHPPGGATTLIVSLGLFTTPDRAPRAPARGARPRGAGCGDQPARRHRLPAVVQAAAGGVTPVARPPPGERRSVARVAPRRAGPPVDERRPSAVASSEGVLVSSSRRMRVGAGRRLGVVIALMLTVLLASDGVWVAQSVAQDRPQPTRSDRVAGQDRFETAALLAERAAQGMQVQRVWIATGANFPDALAAAAAGEPVLLVTVDTLPRPAARALGRMNPDTVIAAGGRSAISEAVLDAAAEAAGANKDRAAGTQRFATAAAIARKVHPDAAAVDIVWLATGSDFPDALAAGPVAATEGAPLLLATRDELPADTAEVLRELRPDEIVVAGGESAVSAAVADAAAAAAGDARVTRLSGTQRFETAQAVADRLRTHTGPFTAAWLATGANFPDALAAGPVAAAAGAPLLLTVGEQVPAATAAVLAADHPNLVGVAGGRAAVPPAAEFAAWNAAADTACPVRPHRNAEGFSPAVQDAPAGSWATYEPFDELGFAVPADWRAATEETDYDGEPFPAPEQDGFLVAIVHPDSFPRDGFEGFWVECGAPFVSRQGRPLLIDDPGSLTEMYEHFEDADSITIRETPADFTVEYRTTHDDGTTSVQRIDYIAIGDALVKITTHTGGELHHRYDERTSALADDVAASVARAGQVGCPEHASSCTPR
jgi:putative cell wall-binding protein